MFHFWIQVTNKKKTCLTLKNSKTGPNKDFSNVLTASWQAHFIVPYNNTFHNILSHNAVHLHLSNLKPIQYFVSAAGSRGHERNTIPDPEGVIWLCMVQRQTHRLLLAWASYCKDVRQTHWQQERHKSISCEIPRSALVKNLLFSKALIN